jgi:hypothetical protein
MKEHIDCAKSKIPIKCNKCMFVWSPTIGNHINAKYGCPHCSISKGYSKSQILWLDNIMEEQKISIQYALSPWGEYKIHEIGKVDGYCLQTNTVYEFHGDYWHGNPDIYESDDINSTNGKTFGELYQKTIERDQQIRNAGYNLITMWEYDFNRK